MKYICILDTETIVKGQEVFDIGIIIATTQGEVILKKQWLIQETFFLKLFFENKRELYLERLENPDYPCTLVPLAYAFEELENIFKFFKIKEVYAYNAGFDSRVIRKIANSHELDNPLEDKQIECLWLWSTQTLLLQKGFKKFAIENNWLTEKGNYKTSAEATFAYLSQQADFVEEHTALEDCVIELEIYKACKKQHKPRIRGMAGNPWLIPQEKEQIEKLPKQFRTMKINLEGEMEKAARLFKMLGADLGVELDVNIDNLV